MGKLSSPRNLKSNDKDKNKNNPQDVKKKTKKRKRYVPKSFLECQSLTHVVGFPPQNELVMTPTASEFAKELFLDRFVKEIVRPFQPGRTPNRRHHDGDDAAGSRQIAATTESNAGYYHVMVGGKLVKKRRISGDNPPSRLSSNDSPPIDAIGNNNNNNETSRKRRIWNENIVIGSNQCLRLLETVFADHCGDNAGVTPKISRPSTTTTTTTTTTGDASSSGKRVFSKPSLIVLAKDVYPPTMLCAVPVLAKRLEIPLLLLPGKASLDLGRALNAKRTSVLVFRCGEDDKLPYTTAGATTTTTHGEDGRDGEHADFLGARASMASFVSFVLEQVPGHSN